MRAQQTVRDTWRRHIAGLLDETLERNDAAIHAVRAEVAERLVARGHVPGVWGSANRGPV
jgi:hypothetical protein